MIIMDIKADNFYSFKHFHINTSYPKRIVDSPIDGEYLDERPNFRYKKVNILMGGNATGKTTLGKLLMKFANYCNHGNYQVFIDAINDPAETASMQVDFVTRENKLYRFHIAILPNQEDKYSEEYIQTTLTKVDIGIRDNYEICAKKFGTEKAAEVSLSAVNTRGWFFAYPEDASKNKLYYSIEDSPEYLLILEKIMKTLDPSVKEVIRLQDLENTYAIKMANRSIIIQNGKILDTGILSSGTKAGLDISYVIASLFCNKHDLYFCDELFSYVNSDIEKACLSVIIEKMSARKQLFFTTHNTDILDMQLPKHSFIFLKKDVRDAQTPIRCIYAEDFLKRNTDSLKHAAENDLFSAAVDLDTLYEILDIRDSRGE